MNKKEILEKARLKKEGQNYVHKCLKWTICPLCGDDLIVSGYPAGWFFVQTFNCQSCGFKYKI